MFENEGGISAVLPDASQATPKSILEELKAPLVDTKHLSLRLRALFAETDEKKLIAHWQTRFGVRSHGNLTTAPQLKVDVSANKVISTQECIRRLKVFSFACLSKRSPRTLIVLISHGDGEDNHYFVNVSSARGNILELLVRVPAKNLKRKLFRSLSKRFNNLSTLILLLDSCPPSIVESIQTLHEGLLLKCFAIYTASKLTSKSELTASSLEHQHVIEIHHQSEGQTPNQMLSVLPLKCFGLEGDDLAIVRERLVQILEGHKAVEAAFLQDSDKKDYGQSTLLCQLYPFYFGLRLQGTPSTGLHQAFLKLAKQAAVRLRLSQRRTKPSNLHAPAKMIKKCRVCLVCCRRKSKYNCKACSSRYLTQIALCITNCWHEFHMNESKYISKLQMKQMKPAHEEKQPTLHLLHGTAHKTIEEYSKKALETPESTQLLKYLSQMMGNFGQAPNSLQKKSS